MAHQARLEHLEVLDQTGLLVLQDPQANLVQMACQALLVLLDQLADLVPLELVEDLAVLDYLVLDHLVGIQFS